MVSHEHKLESEKRGEQGFVWIPIGDFALHDFLFRIRIFLIVENIFHDKNSEFVIWNPNRVSNVNYTFIKY